MNIPRFTAEVSLYKTCGRYQTGRHAINLPTETTSPIHLAVINVPGETVVIVEKWPPDPWDPLGTWIGGQTTGPGTPVPSGGGSDEGGGGGVGVPFDKVSLDPNEVVFNGCTRKQTKSRAVQAMQRLGKQRPDEWGQEPSLSRVRGTKDSMLPGPWRRRDYL